MTLLAASLALTAAAVQAADPKPDPPPRVWLSSTYATRPGCLPSVRAITYYRRRYTAARQAMNLAGAPPRAWYQHCPSLRKRATVWRARADAARRELARWRHYHYAWWDWMPAKTRRVGACETGYGKQPGNFHWDSGTYVSFAGIYRPAYDQDAHRVGNLGWDETKRVLGRYPTPREQMQAVDSHRAAHGGWDGWGCRNA